MHFAERILIVELYFTPSGLTWLIPVHVASQSDPISRVDSVEMNVPPLSPLVMTTGERNASTVVVASIATAVILC